MKMTRPDKALLEKHYEDLKAKPFFPKLMSYMLSGPVVATVWEGKDAVKTGRKLLGQTDPLKSEPGTIRGDFCLEMGRNLIHGSDSIESAEKEIGLWFQKNEIFEYEKCDHTWIYE